MRVFDQCRIPEPHRAHVPVILPGTVVDEPIITEADLQPAKPLWHEDRPRGGPGGGFGGQGIYLFRDGSADNPM